MQHLFKGDQSVYFKIIFFLITDNSYCKWFVKIKIKF